MKSIKVGGETLAFAHTGTVIATLLNEPMEKARRKVERPPSTKVAQLACVLGQGIAGDRHCEPRLSDVRELKTHGIPRGSPVFNAREFSAVSVEELVTMEGILRLPGPIPYGALSENLVIKGIPGFTQIPIGSMLHFWSPGNEKRDTLLFVSGENRACSYPGKTLQQHYFSEIDRLAQDFDALKNLPVGLRGIVGFTFRSGAIFAGDTVRVQLPGPR